MPLGSTGAHDPRWRGVLAVAAITLALTVAVIVGRVMWFDAYWLFRADPPWRAVTDGSNRLLDRQTRRAKVLQALARDYTVALVGSSTVYHGLDPDDVRASLHGTVFNVGISALAGAELPTVASVVASRGGVRRVVIGLDYYMFSRRDGPAPVNAGYAGPIGRWNARLGSVLSRYAVTDSALSRVEGDEDPGSWTRYGFRVTPPLPPDLTRLNDETRRKTTSAYQPALMTNFEGALARLSGRDVQVYLSPVSDAQRRVMADLGVLDGFARWRGDAARMAAAHGVGFHDLVDLGRGVPFDPQAGSTEAWLDDLHFTPVLGRRVLEAVGLRDPAETVP